MVKPRNITLTVQRKTINWNISFFITFFLYTICTPFTHHSLTIHSSFTHLSVSVWVFIAHPRGRVKIPTIIGNFYNPEVLNLSIAVFAIPSVGTANNYLCLYDINHAPSFPGMMYDIRIQLLNSNVYTEAHLSLETFQVTVTGGYVGEAFGGWRAYTYFNRVMGTALALSNNPIVWANGMKVPITKDIHDRMHTRALLINTNNAPALAYKSGRKWYLWLPHTGNTVTVTNRTRGF